MNKMKTTFALQAVITGLVLFAVIVMVNLVAGRGLARADMTADGRFTISEPTIRILSNLRDSVKVTAYISESMPSGMETLRRDVADKLRELAQYSNGYLEYELIDPVDWSDERKEALMMDGVRPRQGEILQRDRLEVVLFYSDLVVTYLDKAPEQIGPVNSANNLEYDLVSKILKLTQLERPLLAFYRGEEGEQANQEQLPGGLEHAYQPFLQFAQQELHLDVREIKLTRNDGVPDNAACLIVSKPRNLNARQVYEINRAASRGVPVVMLVSKIDAPPDLQSRPLEQMESGLEDLLEAWGVRFGDSIISDRNSGTVEVMTQPPGFPFPMMQQVPMPLVPMIWPGLNRESIIASAVPPPGVLTPWVVSAATDAETLSENNLRTTALLRTSQETWRTPFSPMLAEEMYQMPQDRSRFVGPVTVGMLIEGPLPFVFQGQEIPEWPETDEEEEPQMDLMMGETQTVADATGIADLTPAADGRVLLVTSGDLLHYQYIAKRDGSSRGTVLFMANAIETFARGQDLLEIRAKGMVPRLIEPGDYTMAKVFNVAIVPLLVVGFGVARMFYRTAQRNAYLRMYGAHGGDQ